MTNAPIRQDQPDKATAKSSALSHYSQAPLKVKGNESGSTPELLPKEERCCQMATD